MRRLLPGLQPLQAVLRGITNGPGDPSVDVWRSTALPLLRTVSGAEGAFSLKVSKRGAPPQVPPPPSLPLILTCCVSVLLICQLQEYVLQEKCRVARVSQMHQEGHNQKDTVSIFFHAQSEEVTILKQA